MSVLGAVMDRERVDVVPGDDAARAARLPGGRQSRQWRYGAAGCVLALGAPAGLLAVRWLQDPAGGGMMDVIAADLPVFAYVTVSTLVVFAAFGLVLGRQADELLRRLSTDALTGLLNRRAFLERLEQENDRSRRYPRALSVLLLDVDGLKGINDRGGHAAGDAALRAIGDAIRRGLRATDTGCRFGGDEFAVMAPEADAPASRVLAERIRSLAEDMALPGGLRATVSLGVASVASGGGWTPPGILERADRALYEAKRTGRNRVVLDQEDFAPRTSA
jgi:diguanylate cyclase (GGDEF)-like protein